MNNFPRHDADELKTRLPEYLQAIGHSPQIGANGSHLTAICPLHQDSKPSFTAKLDGEAWLWFCHPCGTGGSVIELHALRSGRSAKGEFRTIVAEIAALIGAVPTMEPPAYRAPIQKQPKPSKAIPADELERMAAPWRTRLNADATLREAFAREINLTPDTLRKLTTPSLDALGIVPAGFTLTKQDGGTCTLTLPRLAYIGDGGYKIRDPFGTGKPRFWRVGELRRPWRSHRLTRSAPFISDVHLVESESTAAALIEAGYEEPFNAGSCVVATSGANGFDVTWKPLFAGRAVHFWPDNDPAGQRFFEDTAAILHGTAKRICWHQLNYQNLTA